MVARKKESGQMLVEETLAETKEELIVSNEEEKIETIVEKEVVKPDPTQTVSLIENEYTDDEKPFLLETVTELINEGVSLDAVNFNLLIARKIISKQKQMLNKAIEEQEILLKRLEFVPTVKHASKTNLTLQSYIQDSIVNSETAFEYLSICGAVYLYCMREKLELLGIEIKENSLTANKISSMNQTLKNDTRNALAATIRAFSGIKSDNLVHGISTRTNRKEGAKSALSRWLIDEAVEEIVTTDINVTDVDGNLIEDVVTETDNVVTEAVEKPVENFPVF